MPHICFRLYLINNVRLLLSQRLGFQQLLRQGGRGGRVRPLAWPFFSANPSRWNSQCPGGLTKNPLLAARRHTRAQDAARITFHLPLLFLVNPPSSVDPTHINLKSTTAVNYWCLALHCSETQLRNAVLAVGLLPADVKAYLRR